MPDRLLHEVGYQHIVEVCKVNVNASHTLLHTCVQQNDILKAYLALSTCMITYRFLGSRWLSGISFKTILDYPINIFTLVHPIAKSFVK